MQAERATVIALPGAEADAKLYCVRWNLLGRRLPGQGPRQRPGSDELAMARADGFGRVPPRGELPQQCAEHEARGQRTELQPGAPRDLPAGKLQYLTGL